MTMRIRTCYTLVCEADPQCDWWETSADGFDPHFPTAEEAREYAAEAGWLLDADRTVCARHATEAKCRAEGHDWGEWKPFRCDGRLPEHRDGSWEARLCVRNHCQQQEQRQAVPA